MQIDVELIASRIERPDPQVAGGAVGAWVEFLGIVRSEEDGRAIIALDYEAYDSMAKRVMMDLLRELGAHHGCQVAHVIHRVGRIPVGEGAIWIGVGSGHRREALALVSDFLDRLKQDVPIWKRRGLTASEISGLGP
jgi:molybdopterin synthase catalytic subunit